MNAAAFHWPPISSDAHMITINAADTSIARDHRVVPRVRAARPKREHADDGGGDDRAEHLAMVPRIARAAPRSARRVSGWRQRLGRALGSLPVVTRGVAG
jgi:hypothetical protein